MHSPTSIFRFIALVHVLVTASTSFGGESSTEVVVTPEPTMAEAEQPVEDRIWLISTRHLTSEACRVQLDRPKLAVFNVSCNGRSSKSTLDDYFSSIGDQRNVVMYVHGNRLEANKAVGRGLTIYQRIRRFRHEGPIDWVMFSWPSEKEGILLHDVRRKAKRTDAQSLYLSWVLREHAQSEIPTTLIGFSFGARIVSGALHALAGGGIGGRKLPGEPITGVQFDAGMVAPAMDSGSMARGGDYSLAPKNLDRLLLLYNRRDAVLKRYWLLERVRGAMALGYSGPRTFARRSDGTRLSIRSRDCSASIGRDHAELEYYQNSCRAGSEMARLINDIEITH